jgi:hypothetical protein
VLTKPDRSQDTAHRKWVRFIDGDTEPLRRGWYCVKLHDTESQTPQPSLAEAREQEEQWFNKAFVWQGLPQQSRSHLGAKKLVQHLEEILSDLISTAVPDLSQQIQELEEKTARQLELLGKPPSEDSIGDINSLVDRLVNDIKDGMERRGRGSGNLLYLIEDEAVKLKKELRETCPEFRAWRKDSDNKEKIPEIPLPEFLLEDGPLANTGTRNIIYLDDVVDQGARSSPRGLPDGGQREVAEEYLRSFTSKWDGPTKQFVNGAIGLLKGFIQRKIDAQCGHFSYGGLPNHFWGAIDVHLKECLEKTKDATSLLLKLERSGHTRNDRYYHECKDKFLSHFKLQRGLASSDTMLRDLARLASPNATQPHSQFISQINQVKAALSKVGIQHVDTLDLAKLFQPQASDPALEDMARASAGFEVALHRFVDYVPLIVDTELVQGVCQDLADILRKSLRLSEPNAAERCSELLREPFEVREDRERLKQKLRRLALATEELTNFWSL